MPRATKLERGLKRCAKCGETDVTKFGSNRARADGLQSQCINCLRSTNRSNMRVKRGAIADAKIEAAGAEQRWNLILRKERLFADRGTDEHLIYEHALDLYFKLDDSDARGSGINALEMQVNAGLYGESGEWFHMIRSKVRSYLTTH